MSEINMKEGCMYHLIDGEKELRAAIEGTEREVCYNQLRRRNDGSYDKARMET